PPAAFHRPAGAQPSSAQPRNGNRILDLESGLEVCHLGRAALGSLTIHGIVPTPARTTPDGAVREDGPMTISASAAGTFSLGGDVSVNRLGYGAMRITGPQIMGEPRDAAEARRVLLRAVELGVTFIDTAHAYGPLVSERLIGETLAPYPDDMVIATKGGLHRNSRGAWL